MFVTLIMSYKHETRNNYDFKDTVSRILLREILCSTIVSRIFQLHALIYKHSKVKIFRIHHDIIHKIYFLLYRRFINFTSLNLLQLRNCLVCKTNTFLLNIMYTMYSNKVRQMSSLIRDSYVNKAKCVKFLQKFDE